MRSPARFFASLFSTVGFAPAIAVGIAAASVDTRPLSFNRDIRPILSENCYQCHGFDASTRKGKRRIDTPEGAIAERNGIRAIVPGEPDASELWMRIISRDEDEVMPPPDTHKSLTADQKHKLRRWISEGATYEPHWAFIPPPDTVRPPTVGKTAWPRSDLDRFVLARLEAEKIEPAPEAPRDRWLRRATFDLTGLPPTQRELDEFLADRSADAHAHAVDRILASPRFGERMAVPWLDLARYADSYGYQADIDTYAWPYRDWVIRALNANLPWNEFITWQLAGDLLPNPTRDQRLATAFNRMHRKTNEGGSVPEEYRQDGISDRVHTFGTVFLGLTFECARCHDHKYDPISARDYYALGAYFNTIDEFGILQNGNLRNKAVAYPALPVPTPQQERMIEEQRTAVATQERLLRELPPTREAEFQQWLATVAAGSSFTPVDLAAHYPLAAAAGGKLINRFAAEKEEPGERGSGNTVTPGRVGEGVLCTGDDAIKLPDFGLRHVENSMSFAFWLRPSDAYPRAVVFSNGALAVNTHNGYELIIDQGHLRWSVIREYPGNCASVRTAEKIAVGAWSHVVVSYDGSMRADGLKIYLNGRLAAATVIRDGLTRDFIAGNALEFGARRIGDNGLRGGAVDEIQVFTRAVTPIEAADLHDGESLAGLVKQRERTDTDLALLRDYYFSAHDPVARTSVGKLQAARAALRATIDKVREVAVMEELPEPRAAFVLQRGAYDTPGERVERATPSVLPPLPPGVPGNRLGLAQWLTNPRHPLTARVLVNRLWQEFFGRGLVATVDNFGLQGALPSHPELLDWLARDFIAHGWDYKRACREIVLSATYRQDSRVDPRLRETDPDNILLARGPVRRLTAEMIRDSALALGGILQPEIGGPPAKPYQPDGSMWRSLNNFLPEYKADVGAGLHRRSLYTFWRRTTTPPNMMALDAPTRDVCTARRQTTNTPLQPLVLLNDPQFVEAARALGARMLREGGSRLEDRLAWAFREVTGRGPRGNEGALLRRLYDEQLAVFSAAPAEAAKLVKVGALPVTDTFPPVDLAAATVVASTLFNLDASLMLR